MLNTKLRAASSGIPNDTVYAVAYTGGYTQAGLSTTTVTFSNVAVGAASLNREVMILIRQGASASVSSVTIGGVAATLTAIYDVNNNYATAYAVVPVGTSVTVTVTSSTTITHCTIVVFRVNARPNKGAAPTQVVTTASPSSTPSLAVTTPANGFTLVYVGFSNATDRNITFTNATEVADLFASDQQMAAALISRLGLSQLASTVGLNLGVSATSRTVGVSFA
jgi:hypothetical protein